MKSDSRHILPVLLTAALWALAACTDVEFCYDDHPHRSDLDIGFDWDQHYADNHPDSMHVVAERPVNYLRFEYLITANANNNKGLLLSPQSEREWLTVSDADGNTISTQYLPPGMQQTRLWLHAGEYNFTVYGWDHSLFDEEELQELGTEDDAASADAGASGSNDDVLAGGINAFRNTRLLYRHYGAGSTEIMGEYGLWRNYNPYAEYVMGRTVPVFFANAAHYEVPVTHGGEGQVSLRFRPQPVTQHVTFMINVEKTPDMVVDSITAEISGLPHAINLTTGLLYADRSYKALFRPTYPALPHAADSVSATSLRCQGSVDVTGIVRSLSEDMVTGPGILYIALYTRCQVQADDGEHTRYKTFYAGINLYQALRATPLLEWDVPSGMYRQTCKEAVIEVDETLRVSRDRVEDHGSANTGIDHWIPGESFSLDI